MRVELLYSDADPTYMETRQRLVEVLTEDAFETPIQMIAVRSAEDAELLGFRGSPTIRIDGVDIDPLAADVARANCAANGVADADHVSAGTLAPGLAAGRIPVSDRTSHTLVLATISDPAMTAPHSTAT
jgi:hypothetical protein